MKNIVFFYPSKIVGGAEFLFARIAKYLKDIGLNVYYIDYIDGFVRNNSEFSDLNFLLYEDKKKTELDIDGALITPISNIYRLEDYLEIRNKDMKLLFWAIHVLNLIHVMPKCSVFQCFSADKNRNLFQLYCKNTYEIFNQLLARCSQLNSIYHMDKLSFGYNKTLFPNSIEEKYLPITLMEKNIFSDGKLINDNEINVAFLGRLCKEKIYPVVNTLERLNELNTSKKINVHIIGEGKYKKLIKPEKYDKLNILFVGTIIKDELDSFLIKNADIVFAMGTSILEVAYLKIPAVVVPYMYENSSFNKYYYVFDSVGYCVGEGIKDYTKNANITLNSIIESVYEKDMKKELGEKCYNYAVNNHSIKAVTDILLDAIENDKLNVSSYHEIKSSIPKYKKNYNIVFNLLRGFLKYAKR